MNVIEESAHLNTQFVANLCIKKNQTENAMNILEKDVIGNVPFFALSLLVDATCLQCRELFNGVICHSKIKYEMLISISGVFTAFVKYRRSLEIIAAYCNENCGIRNDFNAAK